MNRDLVRMPERIHNGMARSRYYLALDLDWERKVLYRAVFMSRREEVISSFFL